MRKRPAREVAVRCNYFALYRTGSKVELLTFAQGLSSSGLSEIGRSGSQGFSGFNAEACHPNLQMLKE